jgi:hypothetical protein
MNIDGKLDLDNNSIAPFINNPVENIYINKPLNGQYQLKVNWFASRGSINDYVDFYYVVRINGEIKYSNTGRLYSKYSDYKSPSYWNTFYEFDYPFNL